MEKGGQKGRRRREGKREGEHEGMDGQDGRRTERERESKERYLD